MKAKTTDIKGITQYEYAADDVNFKKEYIIDDSYFDRLTIAEALDFIKAHKEFFQMVCNQPITLINLMKEQEIDSSPLLNIMKNAFSHDEDRRMFSLWMSVSKFRRAMDNLINHNNDELLVKSLFANPTMCAALVDYDHKNDPLLLAWYSPLQKKIKVPEKQNDGKVIKPEPEKLSDSKNVTLGSSWITSLSLFALTAIDSISQAYSYLNNHEHSDMKQEDKPKT